MSGNINKNTFISLAYHELSQEGFGLPSIRSFRVASEEEIWSNPLVLKATDKVKEYAAKRQLSLNFTVDTKKLPTNILQMLLAQRGVRKVEDSVIKECLKYIKLRKINGVNIISIDTVITRQQYVALCVVFLIVLGVSLPALCKLGGTVAGKIGSAVYKKTGNYTVGYATSLFGGHIAGILSAQLALKLSNIVYFAIGKQVKKSNESKNLRIFGSWALFKDINGEIYAKRFCNGVIDPSIKSSEDLESDEVSMTDLVEDETTVEEDAGKDSEVKNVKPTEVETEHNEEASAGGVLTGDNKDELEVKKTSEEALGITDYDLYSEDQYKSLEGIFDPDDLV
jgi:hypothetical protein